MDKDETFDERELLIKANKVLRPLGALATGIGPRSVGVQGDHRVYWPVVYVTFPDDCTPEQMAAISNEVTNKVRGLSRVMLNTKVGPLKFTESIETAWSAPQGFRRLVDTAARHISRRRPIELPNILRIP